MNNYFKLPIYIIVAGALIAGLISFVISITTYATSTEDITFPVADLGGCENEKTCKAYCDSPDNFANCFAFAKKHNLVKEIKGRGGEKTSEEDIEKFAKAMKGGGGPGGCTNHRECEAYCSNIDNMETCLNWAEQNGVMQGRELEEAKKVRGAIQRGAKMPGGCKNKDQCEAYCQNPDHMEECLAFAEEAGFIPKEELDRARQFAKHMKEGKTPGGCRNEQECETYCFEGDHIEECMAFAQENGLATKEEVEVFKKTGGKGPGGCRGRECETFCNKEENQETCFNWAKENGMIKQEDLQRMEEGKREFKNHLEQMPPEVKQCLKETLGENVLADIESGAKMPNRNMGETMQVCFEKAFRSQMPQGGEGFEPREGMPDGIPRGQFEGPSRGGPGGGSGFPPEVKQCLVEKIGEEKLQALQSGPPSKELQDAMQECFGKGQGEGIPDEHGQFPGRGATEGQFPGQGATEGNFPGGGEGEGEQRQPLLPGQYPSGDDFCKQYPERCGAHTEDQTPSTTEGTYPSPTDQYNQQYNQEYQKQYDQQYQQQYDQQYQQQQQQYPSGTTYPSGGTTYPTAPAPTSEPTPTLTPSLAPPKLGEFFLGMLINLLF